MTEPYAKAVEPFKDTFTAEPIDTNAKLNEQLEELLGQLKRAEKHGAQRSMLLGFLVETLVWYFDVEIPTIKHSIWEDTRTNQFLVHRNLGRTSTKPLATIELSKYMHILVNRHARIKKLKRK